MPWIVVIQVDIAVRDMADFRIAACVLRLYVILDGAAGIRVITLDEHEIVSAYGLGGAVPEVERAGMYRERPAWDRMSLVNAAVRGWGEVCNGWSGHRRRLAAC